MNKRHELLICRVKTSLLFFVTCMFFLLPTQAQESDDLDSSVNEVARQLYCPVCDNVTLDQCTSPVCHQWKAEIRYQLEEGKRPNEVVDYFVYHFGDGVLGPRDSNVRILVFVVLSVVFVTMLILVMRAQRSHNKIR